METAEDGRVTRLYLVLNGIRPEDPVQTGMEVHPDRDPSILGIHQGAQIVAVNVADQQVPAVRKNQRRDAIWKREQKARRQLATIWMSSSYQAQIVCNAIQQNACWELCNIFGLSK